MVSSSQPLIKALRTALTEAAWEEEVRVCSKCESRPRKGYVQAWESNNEPDRVMTPEW